MKIKYECRYNGDEAARLIEEQHAAKFPLPEGMKWVGTWESYSGVTVTALKEEKGDPANDTRPEVPQS